MIYTDKKFILATNIIDDSNEARYVRDDIYYIKYHGYEALSYTKKEVELETAESLARKIERERIGKHENLESIGVQ